MDDAGNLSLRTEQFRIGGTHFRRQRRDQLVEKTAFNAEFITVADRTAHDPAQHVAAPFVRRQYAVGDKKSRGPDMIGNDPQRTGLQISRASHIGSGFDQVLEKIDLVIAMDALHDRRQPLQPHAGID